MVHVEKKPGTFELWRDGCIKAISYPSKDDKVAERSALVRYAACGLPERTRV